MQAARRASEFAGIFRQLRAVGGDCDFVKRRRSRDDGRARRRAFMIPRRTNGSPPVSRSFRTPRAMKAPHSRSSSSSERRSAFGRNVIFSDMQ